MNIDDIFLSMLITFLLINFTKSIEPFTTEQLESMNRISSPILSPNGDYLIFSNRKWHENTGKSSTNLFYTNIATKETFPLTEALDSRSDTNPVFSAAFPNYLFFLRSSDDVQPSSPSIFFLEFPPSSPEDLPKLIQLTKYPISINDFKISQQSLIFSADVYFKCETLECSAPLIKAEEKSTYQTYDSLLMFHWDKWLPQGKGSHLFFQKIKFDSETSTWILDGEPKDLTLKMEWNTPPLFTDKSNYDISKDGTMVAFSAHLRNHEEAWSTGWKTYIIKLEDISSPVLITSHTEARTQNPQFSNDGTKVAYLAMITPRVESDNWHFEIYNIIKNKVDIIDIRSIDKSVNSFSWHNDKVLIFQATAYGVNKLYKVDISDVNNPKYEWLPTFHSNLSYSVPIRAWKNRNVWASVRVGYNHPDRVVLMNTLLQGTKGNETDEPVLVNMNTELLDSVDLPQPESFTFEGGYNESVQGFLLRPINFEASKKYPVALLIHGGPESSWTTGWSYGWNPQLWTNQGYAVVMINPHGSTGVSTSFLNAVRNDWGGVPYQDIMQGWQFAYSTYDFLDQENTCAAGGSYGGFMINWIEGHTDIFNCLVNHDGIFSTISMFYSTEELWFPKAEYCTPEQIGCNPFDGETIRKGYEANSPERFVNNWKTPMLVIHGGLDYRVPLTEALSTFTSLQLKNVESKFVYFPEENHWTLKPENAVKWTKEVIGWMDKYTKKSN